MSCSCKWHDRVVVSGAEMYWCHTDVPCYDSPFLWSQSVLHCWDDPPPIIVHHEIYPVETTLLCVHQKPTLLRESLSTYHSETTLMSSWKYPIATMCVYFHKKPTLLRQTLSCVNQKPTGWYVETTPLYVHQKPTPLRLPLSVLMRKQC